MVLAMLPPVSGKAGAGLATEEAESPVASSSDSADSSESSDRAPEDRERPASGRHRQPV